MDKPTIMFMIIICAFTITIGMLIGIGTGASVNHTQEIGQMVCDEYGFGEYQDFDSDNKVVECNEKYVEKTFDSGKVRIVKGDNER